MINRVVLMGRLTAAPELKTTDSGVSVSTVRMAVDHGKDNTAFIDVVFWRHQAEFVCKHFTKGSLIAVEGQLQSRSFKAKDETNRTVVEVVADNVSFTGERND